VNQVLQADWEGYIKFMETLTQTTVETKPNLADFSWVETELQRIASLEIAEKPNVARPDFWDAQKGYGLIYVDESDTERVVEKHTPGAKRVFVHAKNIVGLTSEQVPDGIVVGWIVQEKRGLI